MRRSYHRNTGEASSYIVFEAARDSDAVTHIRTVVADLQYSTDGLHWSNWAIGTDLTIDKSNKVYVRGKHSSTLGFPWFKTEGSMLLKVSGNANALNDWENPDELVGLRWLLYGITQLEDASELLLPATTLVMQCYDSMFADCTSLINAPELPATNLAEYCYANMFYRCSSLINAPALPATNLAEYCYDSMFNGCTSLANAPALPATNLAEYCYDSMFYRCSSLINAPELSATTLFAHCYDSMFTGCKSLINAPALPATNLAEYCYANMFYRCSSLINAPALPATNLAEYCYYNMFNGCTSLANAPALPATVLDDYCYRQMFYNCTSLINAPELSATTLFAHCYDSMFTGCKSLINAPALPATNLAEYCYANMFYRCSSLIKAPVLPATTLLLGCYYYMFYGCTSLNEVWCYAEDISAANCTTNWLYNVAPTGIFHCKEGFKSIWPIDSPSGVPVGWTISDGTEVNVGDILYYTGSELKSVPYTEWQASLGTPVAVCVIPSSHDVYGNGKAGWIAVHGVNEDGSHATSEKSMRWNNGSDVALTKFTQVPTWNNDGQPSTTDADYGYLPSDHITDTTKAQCNGDESARYDNSYYTMIPSPYVNGARRTDYYREIIGGNALSDFNGKTNTKVLVDSNTEAKAAIACSLYSDLGLPAGSWYLPAMGEFGYCAPRFEVIQAALAVCGGVALLTKFPSYWCSTQKNSGLARLCRLYIGDVGLDRVAYNGAIRPFLSYNPNN